MNIISIIVVAMFLATAVAKGREEMFTFGKCDLHIGPPNFWKYFVREYHVPMFWQMFLAACAIDVAAIFLAGVWPGVVLWVVTWCWAEDMAYFIRNPFDSLDATDWVTGGLGGIRVFGQFIPWVYVAGAFVTCIVFTVCWCFVWVMA